MTANQKYQKERAKEQERRLSDAAFNASLDMYTIPYKTGLRQVIVKHKRLQLI